MKFEYEYKGVQFEHELDGLEAEKRVAKIMAREYGISEETAIAIVGDLNLSENDWVEEMWGEEIKEDCEAEAVKEYVEEMEYRREVNGSWNCRNY